MADPPDESLLGSQSPHLSRNILEGVKLPIGRGPLRPTRGRSSIWRSGGPVFPPSHAQTPAQPSGLRHSSTLDSNLAVVIPSKSFQIPAKSGAPRTSHHVRDNTSLTRRRPGRRPKSSSHLPGRSSNYASSGVETPTGSAKRKVGRPRLHPLSGSSAKGKRARPDPSLVDPKFVPFLCEWNNCKAELHNLDTLRKHLFTVHNKKQESGGYTCHWSRCGITRQGRDRNTKTHENYSYHTLDAFRTHVEKAHLIPFAWHMGDGPRGSTLDRNESDASAYLSDAAGRQITPSIASQVVEGGSAKLNNARRLALKSSLIDPSLESGELLVTPALKAGFTMDESDYGTWERIEVKKPSYVSNSE